MSIKNIYKSTHPSINFVTTKGATLSFKEGRYVTGNLREIAELDEEVKHGHPHIFVDPEEAQVDTEVLEALAKARAEAEARVLAEHAEKTGTVVNAAGTVIGAQAAQATSMSGQGLASAVKALPTVRNAVGTVGVAGSGISPAAASVSQ